MRKFLFLAAMLFTIISSGLTGLPVAFFSSNTPVCLDNPVCFTDLSYVATPPFGYITTWVWNYGDGSPTDTVHFPYSPNVCHYYPSGGIFMVTLTVTDNSGKTHPCDGAGGLSDLERHRRRFMGRSRQLEPDWSSGLH